MNWRMLLGLVFLLLGMKALYDVIGDGAMGKLSGSPLYTEIGCVIWITAGIFFIIKGAGNKKS